jgi:hypothetical protein
MLLSKYVAQGGIVALLYLSRAQVINVEISLVLEAAQQDLQ